MPSQQWIQLMEELPSTWDIHQVGSWLDIVGLGNYVPSFKDNYITGEELLELQDEDLVMLGVNLVGHRKRFYKALSSLQSNLEWEVGSSNSLHSDSGSEFSDTGSQRSSSSQASVQSTSSTSFLYDETGE